MKRPLNPKGQDGERLLCLACGSYRHMMTDCPHSWEKMKGGKAYVVEEHEQEESYFTMVNRPAKPEEEDLLDP